jgi:hypothetical protein
MNLFTAGTAKNAEKKTIDKTFSALHLHCTERSEVQVSAVKKIRMSKLGIVDLYADIPIEWYRRAQPRVAVSMAHNLDYWRAVRQASPGTFILGRHYFETQPVHGAFWYEEIVGEAERMRGLYDAWMAINEPAVWNAADAEELRAETALLVRANAQGWVQDRAYLSARGIPTWVCGNISAGTAAIISRCTNTMRRKCGAPRVAVSAARKVKDLEGFRNLQGLNVPIIIAETGIDGGVAGVNKPQRGWREFGDEKHYLESLQWYDAELQKDANVIGAAIFAWRWNIGQGSFDVKECSALRDYMAHSSPPSPTIVVADVELARLCLNVGFGDNAALAVAVVLAESGGDPNAVNVNRAWEILGRLADIGIWQFNKYTGSR